MYVKIDIRGVYFKYVERKEKMSLKQILEKTGLSLKDLTHLLGAGDLVQLRKKAGFETQESIVEAIKEAFESHGIKERTMTTKTWGEYERGERYPSFSLRAWLIVCKLLACTPEELADALEKSALGRINSD